MKILLICPSSEIPFRYDGDYPLGLLYLASILEKKGHDVIVKNSYPRPWKDCREGFIKDIKDLSPDVVGLSCVTRNRISCFDLINQTKRINPNIKIIMGGVHASSLYEQILRKFPLDAIVLGEGETTTPELMDAFLRRKSLSKVKGIAYKNKKGEIKITPPRMPIHNLDEIPFPKHELFEEVMKKSKIALMMTSRGCPYGCTFCSTSVYWGRRWRPRSAKNVVDEIEHILKKFPYVKEILFYDDTMIVDNQRVIDICEEIIRRGIKIKWNCSARIDRVSKEMLIKMKQAGCKRITYGIESGSPKILKSIEKKITREHILKAVQITNEVGLEYGAYLMVGNPGEDWETIKETRKFLRRLKNLVVESIGRLEIYPNTAIYELSKKQGTIEDSYWLENKVVPHYTYEHSADELTKMAYYLIATNQLQKGLFNFILFGLKFFLNKPEKAIRFVLLRLHLIKET